MKHQEKSFPAFDLDLSQQLAGFLDSGLVVTTNELEINTEEKCILNEPKQLKLLQNVEIDRAQPISKSDSGTLNENKYWRRFSSVLESRRDSELFSNGKEFSAKCKAIALDPEYILSGKAVFPWPHPKNVRYVEKYRKVKTLPNGAILAVPIQQNLISGTNEKESSMTKKQQNVSEDNEMEKKRKQKRKRGLKKKS